MPEAATTEFWKDLKPIQDVFKPDGIPEVFYADTTSDDMRYYVPLTETVFTRPLFISPGQNRWCDILMATGPGLVNRHYHPHQVFGFTLSGKWGYLEHDWTATAGDFLYEAPGEAHTPAPSIFTNTWSGRVSSGVGRSISSSGWWYSLRSAAFSGTASRRSRLRGRPLRSGPSPGRCSRARRSGPRPRRSRPARAAAR